MQSKKNISEIVSVVLIVVLLAGMITATLLLSNQKANEWDYHSAEDKFDYYSNGANKEDFQYVKNFEAAINQYFNSLINDSILSVIKDYLEGKLEENLSVFSTRVVNAMASARVSSAKLNKLAQCLKDNSITSFYNDLINFIKEFENADELEEYLYSHVTDFSLFAFLCNFLSETMYETAITENELSEFIYYYLVQNSESEYVGYLEIVGENFFVKLLSNTIYVLTRLKKLGNNDYQLKVSTNSIKSIFYQLGSLYTDISSLSGGAETFEKLFWMNWEYDERNENYELLNELSASTCGKIGGFLVTMGYFMKNISAEDISVYLEYASKDEGREKNDLMIYSAIKLSGTVESSVKQSGYDSVKVFAEDYTEVLDNLYELSVALLSSVLEQSDERIDMETIHAFNEFAVGFEKLNELDPDLDYISSLDGDSEEYTDLLRSANDFYKIKEGFSSLISYIIMVWATNEANSYFISVVKE